MLKRNSVKILVLVLSVFLLLSCTERQVVLTPEQEPDRAYFESKDAFNQAQKEFTTKLRKYNLYCEKEEFKEACSKVDPILINVDKALDIWESVVETRQPSGTAQSDYIENLKELKTKLLLELPDFTW